MNSPGFNDKFAALARQEDAGTVFDDLLTYIISLFSFECPWEPRGHYRMPDVRSRFFELFREIVLLMQSRLQNAGDWYDPFGLFYETYVSSQSRKTCSGQFFTPPHVVDLMVRMQGGREFTGAGMSINDPACGSGRFLIAFNALYPGNFCCGEDIDRTCALMTVCNFILHGVDGEVIWHDSLQPGADHCSGAWRVRPLPLLNGLPIVCPLEWSQTRCCAVWEHLRTHGETPGDGSAAARPRQLLLF